MPGQSAVTVAKTPPYLPASEVIRFGLQIFIRLAIAVFVGVIVMKVGQVIWPEVVADAAIRYGQTASAIMFFASFFLNPVPFPEVYLGPEKDDSEPEIVE